MKALIAERNALLSAMSATQPDEAMNKLVRELTHLEEAIVNNPCWTYSDITAKVEIVLEKLRDEGGVDNIMGWLIERLPDDLLRVEQAEERELERAARADIFRNASYAAV